MDHARSANNDTTCRLVCEIAVSGCCIAGSLLVPEADILDSMIDDLFEDGCYRKA